MLLAALQKYADVGAQIKVDVMFFPLMEFRYDSPVACWCITELTRSAYTKLFSPSPLFCFEDIL